MGKQQKSFEGYFSSRKGQPDFSPSLSKHSESILGKLHLDTVCNFVTIEQDQTQHV